MISFPLKLFFCISFFSKVFALEVPQDVKILSSKIEKLISNLSCTKTSDCTALPVGYKACGGPERYIVVSKKNPNFTELMQIIEEHRKADKVWQDSEGMGSICDITEKPLVKCLKKKCSVSVSQ